MPRTAAHTLWVAPASVPEISVSPTARQVVSELRHVASDRLVIGMTRRFRSIAAATAIVLAGCATRSTPPPSGAVWQRIEPRDFPEADPAKGIPKTLGSVMLRHAAGMNEVVMELCASHGVPDTIASGTDEWALAYLQQRTVYTVRQASSERRAVTSRTISDSEAAQIALRSAPIVIPDSSSNAMLALHEHQGRVLATLGRIVATVPPNDLQLRPGRYPGFTTMAYPPDPFVVDRASGMLFQQHSQDVVVTWVDPQGPAAGLIEVGDTVDAADGDLLRSEHKLYDGWIDARTLTLRKGEAKRDVVVAPQEWPFDVRVVIVAEELPMAVSIYVPARTLLRPPGFSVAIVDPGEILIGVSTGLLQRLDDDELAWVLCHELAHVALGHLLTKPTVTDHIGTVLSAVFSPTLLIPIAGPATHSLVANTASALRRRSNRDRERDADRLATTMACRTGVPADAGLRVMQALEDGPQAPVWRQFLDEHPPYDERSSVIRTSAAQACE